MTFGRTLKRLRSEAGLSRRQLEDLTGLSQRHIAYLESDEKEPGRQTLQALADVLGPKILEAAFPELVGLTGSRRKRATARYLGQDEGSTASGSLDLAFATP